MRCLSGRLLTTWHAIMDHDIIDGAPAARFTQQLKELIESGYRLSDQDFILGGLPPNIRCSRLASLGYAGG